MPHGLCIVSVRHICWLLLYDDFIHSSSWAEHVQRVAVVLTSLRKAGLTANLKKCVFGQKEVWYLGYHLDGVQVCSKVDKTAVVTAYLRPKTKEEMRQFLGMEPHCCSFIPNFVSLTNPLTVPTLMEWVWL